jgi:hypothetical protein
LLPTEPNPFKVAMTTLFRVGGPSTDENDFIPNDQSCWDQDWQTNYGGVDDLARRFLAEAKPILRGAVLAQRAQGTPDAAQVSTLC